MAVVGMGMLSVKAAAAMLGISPSKLYALVHEQAITHFRIGGKILFDTDELEAWKQKCRIAAVKVTPTPRAFKQLKPERLTEAWRKQGVL
jgi:excisionase family DNA binding protein